MTWRDGQGRRRGYHHGNLREALIRAALDLIAEKGPAGFTFAEAARWAGVSSAAPYRHYRDREALLADVARRGFEQRSEEHTSELQSLMRISYAVFCLKKKKQQNDPID